MLYFKSSLNRLLKRKSVLLLTVFASFFIIYCFTSLRFYSTSYDEIKPKSRNNLLPSYQEAKNNKLSESYSNIHDDSLSYGNAGSSDDTNMHNSQLLKSYISDLIKFEPDEKVLNNPDHQLEYVGSDPNHGIYSKAYLNSLISFPDQWIDTVKSTHKKVVIYLTSKIDEIKKELKDPESLKNSNFISHGDGAVILGGAKDDATWLALISTRIFRKSGGVIPIEVMLQTKNDYLKDKEICETYLPQLNAKCVIIEDLLKSSTSDFGENTNIESLILLNFDSIKREVAILLSSFENVLYLAPQNLMLKPLEHQVFTKSLYKENGLFAWGDYGLRKTLPAFYEVSDVKIGKKKKGEFGLVLTPELVKELPDLKTEELEKQLNFHDIQGTLPFKESDGSEIIINKKQHFSTLLLSLYYNLFGREVYYTLLTGSLNGMHGAKETLIAAAHVLNNPYYSINTNVDSNGYWYDNSWNGVSMLQYDPIIDSYSYEAYMNKYSKKSYTSLTWKKYQKWLTDSSERRSPLFLNVNNPSLKPVELLKEGIVVKDNGDRVRLISETSYFDAAFENGIWRAMNDYICHLLLDGNYVNERLGRGETAKRQAFCANMKEHLLWLSDS